MNIQEDWKAKLEGAYSFMLKYSKIAVCNGGEIPPNIIITFPAFKLYYKTFEN